MSSDNNRIDKLEVAIQEILNRNKKVEFDKTWECSTTRKLSIVIITYLTTSIVFYLLGVSKTFLNSFIPTIGYFLSTLTLPIIRKIWDMNINKIDD